MGKSCLDCVSLACLTSRRDKKHQKGEKEKRKWFGRQKSSDSIEFHVEETPPIDPSSSSFTITLPCPPPPPPLPDFAPQPLLPPPSPPPHHPPPSPSVASASNKSCADFKVAKTRQALALASAVAAEAAVLAAKAAAEVVRLTSTTSTHQVVESKGEAAAEAAVVAAKAAAEVVHLTTTTTSTHQVVKSKVEAAAIKIQNAYRGYKARRTLRMLRGMGRLKTLLQGRYVKRQMNVMLSSMRTLTRLQLQIQERRNRLSEENKSRHRLIQKKGHQKERNQNQNLVLAGDFDSSNKSKQQIQARSVQQKDASVRRERALAYAYSHQQTWRKSSQLPHQKLINPNTPDWGWCWLERWMASRPWDPQSNEDKFSFKNSLKRVNSIKTSPAKSKTLKSANQSSTQWPTNNDSKRKNCEGTNHKQSIIGGSSGRVKDDEIIGSASSHKSYLANTQTTKTKLSVPTTSNLSNTQPLKKPKASVGTKGNLDNTEASKSKTSVGTTRILDNKKAVKSKVNVGTTSNVGLQNKKVVNDEKKPPEMVLSKKRLSSSTSVGTTKKLPDSDKAITRVAVGEKKRRNIGSS